MERWERDADGTREVWELELEGTTLTERIGRGDEEPLVRRVECDSDATAEGIRRRMVAQRERQGFASRVRPIATKQASKSAAGRAERPPFPGLTDKKLDAVVNKLEKLAGSDSFKYSQALAKAADDWQKGYALLWYLVTHRLVAAERIPGLWEMMAQSPAGATPEVVADFFARLPSGEAWDAMVAKQPRLAWFTDRFDLSLDALLFDNYLRAPAAFESRETGLPPNVRDALDFVRARQGRALRAERARALLEQVARNAVTGFGLASNHEVARVENGAVVRVRLADASVVRSFALALGTKDEWTEAMVRAARTTDSEASLWNLHDALIACPTDELAMYLSRPFSFGDNNALAWILRLVEDERHDAPDALLEAARGLADRTDHAREIRELLAVVAARRFAEAGREVPRELDALLAFEFFSGVYHESIRPYVAGLAALPRERAMALADARLAQPFGYGAAIGPLLAHPDDARLARVFDLDAENAYLEPELVARLGAAALPHLARVLPKTPRARLQSRHQQVLRALAASADAGVPFDPAWDAFVAFDREGAEVLKYQDPSYGELRARVLRGMPPERRRAVVLDRIAHERFPERALAAASTLDDAALDEAIAAYLPRRAEADRYQALAALRAIGPRARAPLAAHAALYAGDKPFADLVAEALAAQ